MNVGRIFLIELISPSDETDVPLFAVTTEALARELTQAAVLTYSVIPVMGPIDVEALAEQARRVPGLEAEVAEAIDDAIEAGR